ncbi:hypothetical protein XENOCAPTIV_022903 [Xenoophorus captivus]|uniref:Uncharacterized protein n=1 Tax=Xenoophorus captivus TaxID=1517983 RepID=A0ABV0SB23_9TELE
MEQSLRALWEEMEAAERRAEQSHSELLQLYADLHQQASGSHHSRYNVELSCNGQMKLAQRPLLFSHLLPGSLHPHHLNLMQLSLYLKCSFSLPTNSNSAMVDKESQDALQADVSRLEAALVDVRRDVDGLSGCQDSCQHLDRTQHTVRFLIVTGCHFESFISQ